MAKHIVNHLSAGSLPAALLIMNSARCEYALCRHSQLIYRPLAAIKQLRINVLAVPKLRKEPCRLTFVAVNFPVAVAFAVPPCVLDEANNVGKGIAKEQANLVWKLASRAEPILEPLNAIHHAELAVAELRKKLVDTRSLQISPQL